MIQTLLLHPGITVRCCTQSKFKTNCFSLQLVRPMRREDAAANALLPAVLLRGTDQYPTMRQITRHLDDLYGAGVGALVRRVGDYQTTGFYCSFTDDRYTDPQEKLLEQLVDFLGQLLLRPRLEADVFFADFVEGEKRNLLSALEAEKNDKRAYAAAQLMRNMCPEDTLGIPRLGEPEQVRRLDAESLYRHYTRILAESPIEIFYVGPRQPEQIASLLQNALSALLGGQPRHIPPQTGFHSAGFVRKEEAMDVTQGRLQMGFAGPVTVGTGDFAPMQVLNSVLGGMTGKLFMQVREKHSLCYDIGSSYQGSKGILTVSAGMDHQMAQRVEEEILAQLDQCRRGQITSQELENAKRSLLSSLLSVHDSPGAIENYYAVAALSGLGLTIPDYMEQVRQATLDRVTALAQGLQLQGVFLLKGEK